MSEDQVNAIHKMWSDTCTMLEKQHAEMALMAHATTQVPYEGIAAVCLRGAIAMYAQAYYEAENPKQKIRDQLVRDSNIIMSSDAVDHMVKELRKQ